MTSTNLRPDNYTKFIIVLFTAFLSHIASSAAATPEELQQRIKKLEQQLKDTKAELAEAKSAQQHAEQQLDKAQKADAPIKFGHLRVGGAMRANYKLGDYPSTGGGSPAFQDGGNFSLDTFRINLDYKNGPYLGKLEYRWYNGYNFLHTGWLGYQIDPDSQVQVGVNRVPFGPGPYGVSESWLFDQHYYAGLADDMDLGVKYHHDLNNWSLDFGFYPRSEGTYTGTSRDSARYSYDVVNESGHGYEETNQFNFRAIYHFKQDDLKTDLGMSLEYGQLDSKGPEHNGYHYATSVHMINKYHHYRLATQLSYYHYGVDKNQPLGTSQLVQMGAYDFPSTLAATAWIPAVSLSYHMDTPNIYWLDYIMPYAEYSVIAKTNSSFNDSHLVTFGNVFARGNWYIYTDLAFSDGNEFVGGKTAYGDRLGANPDNQWQTRFNINFGYYF